MPFELSPRVDRFLSLLDEARLGWVAEEIRFAVTFGREEGELVVDGDSPVPRTAYSEEEQIDLAIDVFQCLTTDRHKMFLETKELFAALSEKPDEAVELVLYDEEREKVIPFYDPESLDVFGNTAGRLNDLIRRLLIEEFE